MNVTSSWILFLRYQFSSKRAFPPRRSPRVRLRDRARLTTSRDGLTRILCLTPLLLDDCVNIMATAMAEEGMLLRRCCSTPDAIPPDPRNERY
jgi:hypothetical protein